MSNKNMYKCLTHKTAEDEKGYSLVPIKEEDMEPIRLWRNAQKDVLRQKTDISTEEQRRYFIEHILPSFTSKTPPQILFSFHLKGKRVGYGGLVHIDWEAKHAEISFLLDPKESDNFSEKFTHFLKLITQAAFQILNFDHLNTETFSFRQDCIHLLEKFGFRPVGRLKRHVFKQGKVYDSLLHSLENFSKEGLLITSVSKKIPLIDAARCTFSRVYGCDANETVLAKYFLDGFWHCPPDGELLPDAIIRYCKKENIRYLVPTRDQELLFYSENSSLFDAAGINVMISSPQTIKLCQDKLLFSDQPLAIPASLDIDRIEGACYVVKERFGAGSQLIGIKLTYEQAVLHAKKLKNPIFQPYVEGKEYSLDVYRDNAKQVKGVVVRTRDMIKNGESQVTTTVRHPELEALGKQLSDSLHIYGHSVTQVIEAPDGRLHVVECNPRFGGASTAALSAGLDSFNWFLHEMTGIELPFVRSPHEIRQVRYPADKTIIWS